MVGWLERVSGGVGGYPTFAMFFVIIGSHSAESGVGNTLVC